MLLVRMQTTFLFSLQTELAAGGIDIMTLFPAQSRSDSGAFQSLKECVLRFLGRPFPGQTFDFVVRNQIHLRIQPARECGKWAGLVQTLVYSGNEDVLERDHPLLVLLIILTGGNQLLERIFAVNWHDLASCLVRGPMKRNGQTKLQWFIGELANLGREPAGRNRDFTRTNSATPRSIQNLQGFE